MRSLSTKKGSSGFPNISPPATKNSDHPVEKNIPLNHMPNFYHTLFTGNPPGSFQVFCFADKLITQKGKFFKKLLLIGFKKLCLPTLFCNYLLFKKIQYS